VVRDPNLPDYIFARVQDKNTNERSTLKIINFDDYDDYNFKAGIY